MFDIGFGEMLMLAAIALIAIGPKQLPEVARTIGKLLNELKRATGELTKTVLDARDSVGEKGNPMQALQDLQKTVGEVQRQVTDAINAPVKSQPDDGLIPEDHSANPSHAHPHPGENSEFVSALIEPGSPEAKIKKTES